MLTLPKGIIKRKGQSNVVTYVLEYRELPTVFYLFCPFVQLANTNLNQRSLTRRYNFCNEKSTTKFGDPKVILHLYQVPKNNKAFGNLCQSRTMPFLNKFVYMDVSEQ